MNKIVRIIIVLAFISCVWGTPVGSISGHIKDINTHEPLIGANIVIIGEKAGAASDLDGNFSINNVPVGNYDIKISMVGYKTVIENRVIVKPGKQSVLSIELTEDVSTTDVVIVKPTYFAETKDAVVSSRNMDYNEIEMQPGGNFDIQRSIQAFPAVVSASDTENEIIVRGGNYGENLFVIDNIEIPNPNHFAYQGAGGGPISTIYTDFVSEVDFFAGAFPARYGDKASSVLDITLREGARDGFHFKLDLNMAGAGGNLEGPIGGNKKGSYMVSAHRSYMELINSAWRMTAVPEYWNTQAKFVYNINPKLKLSSFILYASDNITVKSDEEDYADDDEDWKYDGKTDQFVIGGSGKKIFRNGYVNLTLSSVAHIWDEEVGDNGGEEHYFHNHSTEAEHSAKTDFFYTPFESGEISAGLFYRYCVMNYDYYSDEDTLYIYYPGTDSIIGSTGYVYGFDDERNDNTHKYGGYVQYKHKFGALFETLLGVRYDALDYTGNSYLSPRISARYRLTAITSVNAAFGRHYQPPDYYMLAFNGPGTDIDHYYTDQYVLGLEHFFSDDIRATVEGYYKKYIDYPVESSDLTDDPHDYEYEYVNAVDGEAKGIELFIQKKVKKNFWGTISYSLSEASNQDPRQASCTDTVDCPYGEYPKSFDYGHVATFIVGYQKEFMNEQWYRDIQDKWWWQTISWVPGMPSDESGYSIRYRYLGGRPTTNPIYDENLRTWYVPEGTPYNQDRMPYYSRLDFHVQSRWYFGKWTLFSYVEIDNVLGRDNVWGYNRHEDGDVDTVYQLNTMFVGGVIIEF